MRSKLGQQSVAMLIIILAAASSVFFLFNEKSGKAIELSAITRGECDTAELFHISHADGGHVELNTGSNYEFHVCAPESWSGSFGSCLPSKSNVILRISRATNAHAERHDIETSFPGGQNICFEDTTCQYRSACETGESCLASLSRASSANVGPCNRYPIKICCVQSPCDPGQSYYYKDEDNDGYGSDIIAPRCQSGASGDFSTTLKGDCDDTDPSISAIGNEICDGKDNNCNGETDEYSNFKRYYKDSDGDGIGTESDYQELCAPEEPYTATSYGDCNDNDPYSICTDYYADVDNDGHGDPAQKDCLCAESGVYTSLIDDDCDDGDENVHPYADEDCYDGIDNDCNGMTDKDDDSCDICDPGTDKPCEKTDGVCLGTTKSCSTDGIWNQCYYDDIETYEAPEASCDGLDNDCDGEVDENWPLLSTECFMGIGECESHGTYVCKTDNTGIICDAVPLDATDEICDGLDNDCDGQIDNNLANPDADKQDGVCQGSFKQCNGTGWIEPDYDTLSSYEPVEETCDDQNDNDCDGLVDMDDIDCLCTPGDISSCPRTGVCIGATRECTEGRVWGPCDYEQYAMDNNISYEPNGETICDGLDNDCDGEVDENTKKRFYRDADDDGFGNPNASNRQCDADSVYKIASGNDCDDSDNEILGCTNYFEDKDGDGYGDGEPRCLCSPDARYVAISNADCNDDNASINPGATEICHNDIDDDCDGSNDEDSPCETGWKKVCGIDKGECTKGWQVCYNGTWKPCDGVQPTNETCDNKDNNCNGLIDELFDVDKDGFTSCQMPVADCNDLDKKTYPAATEICGDSIDQNCDGKDSPCQIKKNERVMQSPPASDPPQEPIKQKHPCKNGIKDPDEEGIDCGGTCAPCISEEPNLLWLILLILAGLVLVGGGTAALLFLKKPKKIVPRGPDEAQLLKDIWQKIHRGVSLANIRRFYLSRGISPALVQRAIIDFEELEIEERRQLARQRIANLPKYDNTGKVKQSADQKKSVFDKLKELGKSER